MNTRDLTGLLNVFMDVQPEEIPFKVYAYLFCLNTVPLLRTGSQKIKKALQPFASIKGF